MSEARPTDERSADVDPPRVVDSALFVERIQYTIDDFRKAAAIDRRRRWIRFFLPLTITVCTLCVWMLQKPDDHPLKILYFAIFGAVVWGATFVIRLISAELRLRKSLHASGLLSQTVECRIGEEELEMITPMQQGKIRWEGYIGWCESNGLLLAYRGPYQYQLFPTHRFHSAAAEALRSRLGQAKRT